jgi:hypothetical protein
MQDNKRKLYDALSQDYDMGTFEQFQRDIEDNAKREKLYNAISNEYDLGDYNSFSAQLMGEKLSPTTPLQPIEEESEYVTGFSGGIKQGADALYQGNKYFAGEVANAYGGGKDDAKRALELLNSGKELPEEEKTPWWKAAGRAVAERIPIVGPMITAGNVIDTILPEFDEKKRAENIVRETLEETNGDREEAKRILNKKALTESWGDEVMAEAADALSEHKPIKGTGAWIGNLIPQMGGIVAAMGAGMIHPVLGAGVGYANMAALTGSTMGSSMQAAREAGASNEQVWAAGLVDGAIELATEQIPFSRYTGRIFNAAKSKISKELLEAVAKNPKAQKEMQNLLSQANKELGGKLLSKNNVADYMGDMLAEGGSEFVAGALQTMTPMLYENPENYPTITEIFRNGMDGAAAGLFMGAVLGAGSKSIEYKQNRNRRKEQGFVLVAEIQQNDEVGIGEVLGYSQDQKTARVLLNGEVKDIPASDIKAKYGFSFEDFERAAFEKEACDAHDAGYNTTDAKGMNDAKLAMENARERVVEVFSDKAIEGLENDPVATIEQMAGASDEEIQTALDFVNAKAFYYGMTQRVSDDIDSRIAESDAMIDGQARSDGTIQQATMKEDGRTVFVLSGKVEDKNGVVESPDGHLIILDNGERKMISADKLQGITTPIDATAEKARLAEEIRNTYGKVEEAKINGVLGFAPGDVYSVIDDKGAKKSIEVVQDNGETVEAVVDGKSMELPKKTIQAMVDKANKARVADPYALNKEVAVPVDGKTLKGIVVEAENEDGKISVQYSTPQGERVALFSREELDGVQPVPTVEVANNEQPRQTEIPIEGKGKNARTAYHLVPVERTLEELHTNELSPEEITAFIDNNIKEAQSELKKVDNEAPKMGTDISAFKAAKAEWKQRRDAVQAKVDYYNQLKLREEEITRSELQEAANAPVEVEEVITPDELVSTYLGGIKITPESFKRETGLGNAEQGKLVGYIANEDKGGVSVERAAEIIAENYGDELAGAGFNGDVQDIRDMIISVLSDGSPKTYAKRGAEQRAQAEADARRDDIASFIKQTYDMELDDYIAYEEGVVPRIIQDYKDFDEQEYYSILANEYNNEVNYDTERESESTGRGRDVLQAKQPVNAAGVEPVGAGNEGGTVPSNVQGGSENAVAQGETEVTEPVGISEQLALQNGNNELTLQQENEQNNVDETNISRGGQVSQSVPQGEHGAQTPQIGGMEETAARLGERIEADGGTPQGGLSRDVREIENRVTREYAQENGLWIPFNDVFKLDRPSKSGNEHDTYVDTENRVIYKVNNRMNTPSIVDLLNRMALHNKYFPESKYSLVGFTAISNNGDVWPVFAQDYVPGARVATNEEIDAYMGALGFTPMGNGRYTNGEIVAKDLHPRNVLADADGDIYVVDAEFEPAKQKSGEKTSSNAGNSTGTTPEWLNKVPDDGRNFYVYVKLAGEKKFVAINLATGATVDRLLRAFMVRKEKLQSLVEKLPSALYEGAEFQIRDAKGKVYYSSGEIKEKPTTTEDAKYTIAPAQYTTKKGKVLDMFLLKIPAELNSKQSRVANSLVRGEYKGWWDKEQGGFMMRSEDDAIRFGEYLADLVSQEPVELVSMDDIKAVNNGDVAFTEPKQTVDGPVWQYSIHVDKDGYTTISRDDVRSGYPIGDARFRYSTDSPEEMLDILRNPLNGMQEALEAVGVTLENKIKTRNIEREAKEKRRREYEALRENGVNGYEIGEKVIYTPASGTREPIEATIHDFEEFGAHNPVLDVGMAPVMYEVVEWSDISKVGATVEPQKVNVESLFGELNKKGEAKLSDHVEQPKNEGLVGLVSDERMAELKERLRKKLGGQMNIGIDPEILAIGLEIAVGHIDRGVKSFADFARVMIADLGDVIRPYLKAFYNGARELPEITENGFAEEMTPYNEVQAFDVANFDKQVINAIAAAETIAREQEVNEEVEIAQERIKNVAKSEKKAVTSQPNQLNLFEYGTENSRTDNSRAQSEPQKLSDIEQVGARTSVQHPAKNSEGKRGNAGTGRSKLGDRPQYDVNKNYTNEEIGEIVSSVTDIVDGKIVITGEVTDDIKTIVRGYKSGGVSKKGRGILDEYYTDGKIVDAVNMLIAPYYEGTKGNRVLEPSVGVGNFIEAVDNIPTSEIQTFEINDTTARIAKILYPGIDVNLRSFETEFIDESGNKKPLPKKFNLVIGNPPYGSHRGLYKGLGEESKIARYEDYFVKRSLDVLEEGGVLAMVLPSSWIDRHTKFGGYTIEVAHRLPSGAFEATQVGTDIVILKKDSSVPVVERAPYFKLHPERVLGDVKERTGRYGRTEQYVEGNIDAALEAIRRERAGRLADILNIEKNNDNLNDIEAAIEEAGGIEKAKSVVESEKADSKPVKKSSKPSKYKVELNRGVETVPTSSQFTHEFSEGEVEAFADTEYDGTLNNPTIHKKYANYIGGRAVHDFYYAEGDIYDKLAQLEQERSIIIDIYGEEQYNKQKRLLESVLPKRKGLGEITISPNTTFVKNLNIDTADGSSSLKDAFIAFCRKLPHQAFGDSSAWEVIGYINNEQVHGTDKRRNQRIRERRKRVANDLFVKFLNEELSDKAKSQVVTAFNREYNSVYRPDYSKVPMFSTINRIFKDKPLKLTDVQLAGIGRMTVKGVGVLAHEVGFGKTLSGILAMHEAMTRGFAKKPLIVVPNDNILKQWIETINEVLPKATVNTLGNLGAGYDLTDFKVNDGEFTLVTYEGLKAMSFSDDTYNRLADRFSYITEDLKKHQSERDIQKEIEKKQELKGKMRRGVKTVYGFEDFGFDWLTVDEVHNANHIVSKVRLDKSVSSDFRSQSQRTSDLGLKTWLAAQYIQEENDGRNVLLLSATPFTNKPLEYYSILSLVANKMLERKGFFNVDQFFATFMEADNEMEMGANNRPVQKTNVRRFRNNGLFQQLLSEFIDIKGEEDNPELIRPTRLNKEYKFAQNELTAEAIDAAQELLNDNDTVLQGISHARAAAFSPYATPLLGAHPKDHKEFVKNSPKIDATIKMIEQNKKDRPDAGQIIYSEVGVEFFPMMRDYLVKESGFKPNEVRIITGATSNNERVNIQTAFNNGEVKVVIGSPAIKEGLNLQGNTTDMYILSLPWNFTQLRQIEGRGWRQGNKWENIRINYMLTNNSVDVFMLQRLQLKQGLYNEAMKSGAESLDVSDIDTAELKTALITDPAVRAEIVTIQEREKLMLEKTQIEADLSFVTRKYEAYNKLISKLESQKNVIKQYEKWAEKGDAYWADRLEREKTDLQTIVNDIEQEKENLAKKGVIVDDIVRQTEQAQSAIAAIQEKIDNLKEYQQELTERFRKENEAKEKLQGDLLATYLKERKAENNSGFYKIRPKEGDKLYRASEEVADNFSNSDDELALESDPVSKALGKPRGTRKQRREFAERERKRMVARVDSLAKKLHLDNVEVVTDASTLEGKKQRAKGFYSKSTGKITIVIPNHRSTFDVEQTLLHEAVAHYGLRQLFGESFDTFLDNVYYNASEEIRAEIDRLAMEKYDGETRTATEEYLASLAENTNFENAERSSWWQKVKRFFVDMLAKAGVKLDAPLTDNELRYILWRSYENLAEPGRYRSILGEAADVAKQYELGVGNYGPVQAESVNVAEGAEEQQIIDRAKADGSYMKAPNGKPTKLTPKQWVQVRTEAFKKWFGDWLKAARIEKLKKSKPIEITGNEIETNEDVKIYRDNAKKYGLALRGEYINADTGNIISLSKGSIKEVTSHDVSNEQLQSVAAIPQIIENSIYIDTAENAEKGKHPDVVSYDYYVCGLKIAGVDYTVKAVVANSTTGERYYDHKLTQIEKGELISLTAGITNPGNENNSPLSQVKDKRLVSILQTNASKVVDVNGEPMVVYHGTGEEFTTFEMQDGSMGRGAYFTSNWDEAAEYAMQKQGVEDIEELDESKVMEVFLNVRDADNITHSRFSREDIEVLATEPSQIKSATDNEGTFDVENNNILFREGTPATEEFMRATMLASDWRRTHKGAAKCVVVQSAETLRMQLESAGFTEEDIAEIEKLFSKGYAVYSLNADKVVLFDINASEDKIIGYLWHENAHRAIRGLYSQEEIERVFEVYFGEGAERKRGELLEAGYKPEEVAEEGLVKELEYFFTDTEIRDILERGKFKPKEDATEQYREFINFIKPIVKFIKDGKGQEPRGGRRDNTRRDNGENEGDTRANRREHTVGRGATLFNALPTSQEQRAGGEQLSFEEAITQGLIEVSEKNAEDNDLRLSALKQLTNLIKDVTKGLSAARIIRGAAARQKDYDKFTVQRVMHLANIVINSSIVDAFSRGEVKRLIGAIHRAVGKRELMTQANEIVDILVDSQIKACNALLAKQLKTKASKVNASGVEVQAGLDLKGQRILAAFKDGIKMSKEVLAERIGEATSNMVDANAVIAENAEVDLQGYKLASKYKESIEDSKQEEKSLKVMLKEIKEQYNAGKISSEVYKEMVESTKEAILSNKLERVDAYYDIIRNFGTSLRSSIQEARKFRESEIDRVKDIQHNANSDMLGRDAGTVSDQPTIKDKITDFLVYKNPVTRFLMLPVSTFQTLLKKFGERSVDGKGYLYRRFMPQFEKANDTEYRNMRENKRVLDNKVSEIFGGGVKYNDLARLAEGLPKMVVQFWDNGVMKERELSQGNLMYIYMVNKMVDGRMKLRGMHINEEEIKSIISQLDPRFLELADWMQEEFLQQKREEYNKVHERMFGAAMANIDSYFPLVINKRGLDKQEDISQYEQEEVLPSTITGAIKKRVRNNKPLDIDANALNVVIDHLHQMEHWAAFAEFNRDINTLLSYRHFKNQVLNMKSVRYGNGEEIWQTFKDCCALASGTYRPKTEKGSADDIITNLSRGVALSKVALRINTAIKQLLSLPAFINEAGIVNLGKSIVKAADSIRWAMKNLPGYLERVENANIGDTRLLPTDVDWGGRNLKKLQKIAMMPNVGIDALAVAIGAKAVYDTKLEKYIEQGYDETRAKDKALIDAAEAYNATQQSSEGAYLSRLQRDRTVVASALSVFRNNSFGYTRIMLQSIANLKRMLKEGYKEESIAFMAKQMVREGVSEGDAVKFATRAYNNAKWKSIADFVMFGYGLQLLWNLGGSMWYFLLGDDDEEKERILEDAVTRMALSPLEGLNAGDIIIDAADMAAKQQFYNSTFSSPFMADISKITQELIAGDEVRGISNLVNCLMACYSGVSPQYIIDAAVAIIDMVEGELDTAQEVGYLVMRLSEVPQSQIDKFYLDELGMNAAEAKRTDVRELAKRYAIYKRRRDAGAFNWMYSDAEKSKVEEKYLKRFETMYKERAFEDIAPEDMEIIREYEASGEFKKVDEELKFLKTNRSAVDYATEVRNILSTPEGVRYQYYKGFEYYNGVKSVKAKGYKSSSDYNFKKRRFDALKKDIVNFANKLRETQYE